MPVAPARRRRLAPPEWQAIRRRILARAGHRCEGSPRYPDCRAPNYRPHPVTGSPVVLTIAHMNQDDTDDSDGNLRALCQRCHNTHDGPSRALKAARTRARTSRSP